MNPPSSKIEIRGFIGEPRRIIERAHQYFSTIRKYRRARIIFAMFPRANVYNKRRRRLGKLSNIFDPRLSDPCATAFTKIDSTSTWCLIFLIEIN